MILEKGRSIQNGGIRYKITDFLHGVNGGYREEYAAVTCNKEVKSNVRIIVYKKQPNVDNICVHMLGIEEATLRNKLCGQAFEAYRADFEMIDDDGKPLMIIVTDFVEGHTLQEAVEKEGIVQSDIWRVFTDVVVGLNEISHHTNGGCHFGLSPDNIYVFRDENGKLHGLLRGLNLVCSDFDKNVNLDKSIINPAFRAPETHMRPFTPLAMQWSLALLLTYMLQGVHPWELIPDVSSFAAYSHIRRNKPKISINGELGDVLRKALSIDPTRRFDEIDDFISEVMKRSNMELPSSYECFGKPTLPNGSHESSTVKAITEDADEEDNEKSKPIADMGKEPKSAAKISTKKGDGFKAVAGMSELKDELRRDFLDVIANRELASQYGIIPPGMLFYGPPGCGKTYLAEHLAQELGIDFSLVNPSDLGSIYIHGSQKMIADLFTKAEKKAKSNGIGVLLIFDELESMVPSRKSEHNENQAGEVAEFLTRLNNSSQRGVYVIGLTNCLDKIDKAVLRKGRFDKVVYIDLPDFDARKALFEYELSKRPHADDIDTDRLATITDGYTSSDITYIVTESAREMFSATLKNRTTSILNITQFVLENIIAKTRPSVTKTDLKHYEKMRDEYASGEKKHRPSVGFNVG